MVVLRTLLCAFGLATLAGCATPNPPLTDAGYDWYASSIVGTSKCVEAGHMSPEVGALGSTYDRSGLFTWSFDRARMEENMRRIADGNPPNQAWCNSKAMAIAQKHQQIAIQNENNAAQAKQLAEMFTPKPTVHTYCNQIGTQTLCTSN